jgi:DNA-binding CsgD family transcriptional regulator
MDYFRAKYREKKKIEEIKTLIVEMTIPDDDTFRRIRNVVKSATMTDRQKTVFRMIGRGMNNQEIASALHLSIDTVRSHVKAINRRLRTSNRVKIALTAHKIFHD